MSQSSLQKQTAAHEAQRCEVLDDLPFDFLVAALFEGVQDAVLEAGLELDLGTEAKGQSYNAAA